MSRNSIFDATLLVLFVISVSTKANLDYDSAPPIGLNISDIFTNWMEQYGRTYSGDEKEKRLKIFHEKYLKVQKFNLWADSTEGDVGHRQGINGFADLTSAEFFQKYSCKPTISDISSRITPTNNTVSQWEPPTNMNWTELGFVTPVRDQETRFYYCGCCYAMAMVAAVEFRYKQSMVQLKELSVQQIIDCSEDDEGCNGGSIINSYRYMMKNGGITSERNYKFRGYKSKCNKAKERDIELNIRNANVFSAREDYLQNRVADQAVTAVLHVGPGFLDYKHGIFGYGDHRGQEELCGKERNHAVLIVGYGTEESTNRPYWIIKNSWGKGWGEQGYMRIRRNYGGWEEHGMCGIAEQNTYPIL